MEGYQAVKLPGYSSKHFHGTSLDSHVSDKEDVKVLSSLGVQKYWVIHNLSNGKTLITLWQNPPFPTNLGFHASYLDS